jgi:predicted RNA-binding Zn-ribbon protein involved in translation (DUF1610 family)
MNNQITKEILDRMYTVDRFSPEEIGKIFDCSGRTIRNRLKEYGIPRLGPKHLRSGKTAYWNVGIPKSKETKAKLSAAQMGKTPHNKGNGNVKFSCAVCAKEVIDKPYRRKNTCSKECKDKYLSQIQGEQHWNYKGQNAGFRQRTRNWAVYRAWRKSVFENSNYTCQKCGYKGRLTAHHLNSFAEHEQERFDPDNGAALCWKCHWSFHRQYGHKFCTKEQFNEWITMC